MIPSSMLPLVCGMIGAILVSQIADCLVRNAAAPLDPLTRGRILEREARASFLWRAPDVAGGLLIVAGILTILRYLKPPLVPPIHGAVIMSAGLALVCLANALRAWRSWHSHKTEAPRSPAASRAMTAALMVSAAEMALSAGVCWFVFTHLPDGAVFTKSPPARQRTADAAAAPDNAKVLPDWVEQTEALRLLNGKPAWYLETLVKQEDIRAKDENGVKLYLRSDLEARRAAGLPDEADLKKIGGVPR